MSEQHMASTPLSRALNLIDHQHAGETVLSLTFGREVALDRARRFVMSMAQLSPVPDLPVDDFTAFSYWIPGTCDLPANAIAFIAYWYSGMYHDNVIETEIEELPSMPMRWCVLDWRVTDPNRIIPSTMHIPYIEKPSRREAELSRTDMLPLWFRQSSGELGVPILGDSNFYCLPDTITRIKATTLKVAVHVSS